MSPQGLLSCSASPAPEGDTLDRVGANNCGQNLVCLPQPTLPSSMCRSSVLPVFTCFHLLRGTRICDLNVWGHHFKSHLSLLRAWDRCQGCCLIVSNIKAVSDYERNPSSTEINEIPFQSALLFGLWSIRPWEVIWERDRYCWHVSLRSHLTFLPQQHSSP